MLFVWSEENWWGTKTFRRKVLDQKGNQKGNQNGRE
jgi:hypothetical protein